MTTRKRRYAPRPESIRLDWPSAFKIAVATTILQVVLWIIIYVFLGMGLAFFAAMGR